ncbi:phosphatidyl-myo-inositol dimannoside synthase [Anaerolineae bacterium]|nr:phosphatidyl-myo-inositol dimannoside synthase [Anaerolineae bacterium]
MARTKIALVTPTLSELGGVPNVVDFIFRTLQKSGDFEIAIISLATSSRDAASVRIADPRTWLRSPLIQRRLWIGREYLHVGAWWTEIELQRYKPRRILTEALNQYDLVQVVAGTPAFAYVTAPVKVPVCLFVATTIAQDREPRLRQMTGWRKAWLLLMTGFNRQIERWVLRHTAYIFAESEYTQQLLSPYVPAGKLHLGPPGVDTDFFKPREQYCKDGYLVTVGRLADPRKNVRLLLTAYHQLRQQLAGAPKLVLVGHSGLAPADQEYTAALGLTEFIEMHLDVSTEQLCTLYRKAALFVLSSDEEGLGIVILEAMACGLPVISTDCGGPATAIQPGITGLLTPVGDSAALAQAMLDLLQNPERRRSMGQAGRAVIEQHFSLEAAGKVYLDTYAELLARRAAGQRQE